MTTKYTLETCDPATNTVFTQTIPGLLEFKVTRSGNATPGSAEFVVTPLEDEDSGSTKRFYPFLKIRVYDEDENMPFTGKIDTAELREDEQYGRVWHIKCRDRMAILADNYIDRGKWNTARLGHAPADEWVPNYSGNWNDDGNIGEYRKQIIRDLALNVLNDDASDPQWGVQDVEFNSPPNSKRIEVNYDNDSQIAIIDAIRSMALSDPWAVGLGAEVDAKDIADAGFPDGSGFGGEFQMKYRTTADQDGDIAEYFQRGVVHPVVRVYRYGPSDPADTGPIVSYNFDKEGADIFSRSRVTGRGEAAYQNDTAGTGRAVTIPGMESTWSPEGGLFNIRREAPVRVEGLAGDWTRENLSSEQEAIRARGLRDAAYAQLQSGAAGLKQYRGINRGSIVIGGLPGPEPNLLRPGDLLRVIIPQIGLTDDVSSDFICDTWTYAYPEDQTTIDATRKSYTNLGEQLVEGLRRQLDSSSAHNNQYDSDWRSMDGTGRIVLTHNLGVKPRGVRVEAAQWDGSTVIGAHKIPTRNTESEVHQLYFDAAQGQYVGYTITESTPYEITVVTSRWLAYTEGAGVWLKNNDPNVLVRVVLTP